MAKYLSYAEAADEAAACQKWFGVLVRVVELPDGYWGLWAEESYSSSKTVWILS
jgi:hypothetical protein